MSVSHEKSAVLTMIEIASKEPKTLYQQPFINYRGATSDTHEPFTEVIAKWLFANIAVLYAINTIYRKRPYHMDNHDGIYQGNSNREEERIAMDMFRFCKDGGKYDIIGEIIDYQTPLKSTSNEEDKKVGKIDLLAYDGNYLRILELKQPDSTETMLRCVLEGYTYLKTVDTQKLLKDFCLPANTKVVACPFVFKPGAQYTEMQRSRPMLRKLMLQLNSEPLYINSDGKKYFITEV